MDPEPFAVGFGHQSNDAILEVKVDAIFGFAPVSLDHGCVPEFLGHRRDLEILVRDLGVGKIRPNSIVMLFKLAAGTVSHQVVVHDFINVVKGFARVRIFVELVFAIVLPIFEEVQDLLFFLFQLWLVDLELSSKSVFCKSLSFVGQNR